MPYWIMKGLKDSFRTKDKRLIRAYWEAWNSVLEERKKNG